MICIDCGKELPLQVLHSNAGYYIGTFCSCCGPYSRDSCYFRYRKDADRELDILKRFDEEDK